jgi:hypothetical protein
LNVVLIDVAAVVAAEIAAMIAAVVHVAICLMMVMVVAHFDLAQWVSVETIGEPLVADQR